MDKGLETILRVENIRLKAQHGWYEEERIMGGMYSVSVTLYDHVSGNETFTDLDESINYERIYNNVVSIMAKEFHLIESSCKAIHDAMKLLKKDAIWEVQIIKENPPIKFVESTQFTLKG